MKDTFFSENKTLNCKGNLFVLNEPKIMYILNATDDSFYENSRLKDGNIHDKINTIKHLQPDIIDIGGQSTRPGAPLISTQEELDRVIPVVEMINNFFEGPISIDTFRSEVAQAAIDAGASIINDVSGGQMDSQMYATAAQNKTPYVLMHMRGTPKNMQKQTDYDNVIVEIKSYFSKKIELLKNEGVKDIILDPGFGFAKTTQQNLLLIKSLNHFKSFKYPILMGVSRKSTIQKIVSTDAENAINGSTILHTLCLQNGANILRVHDVKEAKECVTMLRAYQKA